MKKIFTLICALVGFASMSSAATVDDLVPLKHSYVLVCDELGARPGKGVLFGDDHFLDVTGGSTATNKGQVDLSVVNEADDNHVTQAIVDKYGADYAGPHYNFLRLKNAQDVIAMKLTAGSKIIIFEQGNNKTGTEARIPKIAKSADLSDALNPAPDADHPTTDAGFRWEYTVDDDGLFYIGSYNSDMFVSYIIIEAQEAEGTPQVKMGAQTYEEGLWFKEVTVTPGLAYGLPTEVYYTTDGTEPTADSQKYTAPIKCYKEMTLKFQAFLSGMAIPDANNEVSVSFSFNAPSIDADGANVTITSAYEGAKNYYSLNGGEAQEGSNFTLTESATVAAYSKIVNGTFATFTTKTTTKDVYVLNPIKSKKVIEVIAGDVVLDEEATNTSTTGPVYTIENGEISADKMDFFVKDLTFKAVTDAQYQAPEGNERYIQMSNTNITFKVAAGDEVNVKVVCSKNSCKTLNPDNDESVTTDRKCYVNVSGTTYGNDDVTAEDGNIIEFTLKGGKDVTTKDEEGNDVTSFEAADTYYTFQKYSGTGNILISSIEIAPAGPALADFEDGKYYLINVASEKAWGCGNAWGTQASLVEHPEYVVLHKQADGTYFMETQVTNGNDSYYFGGDQGAYMDGKPEAAVALSFILGEELGEDEDGNPVYTYYITRDGTNFYGWDGESTVLAKELAAGDEKAQWMIASHEQAVAGLAAATEEDPMDATFLILNPNFGRNNRNADAWTIEASNKNLCGGRDENKCAESWQSAFTLSQTIEVPNGKYVLVAQAALTDYTNAYDGTDYPVIYANDATSKFNNMEEADRGTSMSQLSDAFTAGKYKVDPITVIVTDGKLTVGAKGTRTDTWCIWDNFELEYYGAIEDGIETVLSTKVLNSAIYNLAGQKVDANYKGVVIKNGKKMLQK